MNIRVLSLLLLLLFLLACAPFGALTPTATPTILPTVTNTPSPEAGTGEISGKVLDSSTSASVSSASISTNPPTSSVTTDVEGKYSIPGIPPGDYTVTATKFGYESVSVEVAVVAGKTTTADLHLIAKSTDARTSSTTNPALTDGLIAYYPFSGNADDESGNGNHGIVYGATLAEDRFGKENNAYYFDGADDLIQIDDFSISYDSLSISAWVLLISHTPKDPQIIGTPDSDRAFQLEIGGVNRVEDGRNAKNSIMWNVSRVPSVFGRTGMYLC